MTAQDDQGDYLLGSSDAEHERLILQAIRLAPVTERFFRETGIGLGQRVLDVGSDVGDVAMLLAWLVGSSGEVVAIERDARSINRARSRASQRGLRNVTFVQTDIAQFSSDASFEQRLAGSYSSFFPIPSRHCVSYLRE